MVDFVEVNKLILKFTWNRKGCRLVRYFRERNSRRFCYRVVEMEIEGFVIGRVGRLSIGMYL